MKHAHKSFSDCKIHHDNHHNNRRNNHCGNHRYRGQTSLEFLICLAVLLAIISLFLSPLVKLSKSSEQFAKYSVAESGAIKEAYFLSFSKLSGAEGKQGNGFELKGSVVYANSTIFNSNASVMAPFALGIGKIRMARYNVE